MTLGSLSTKSSGTRKQKKGKSSLLQHTIGSYWWLAFACGIVYFFAGPIFTLLYLNGLNFDASNLNYLPAELHQHNIEQIARWMSAEGMIPLYLSAVVLSMILGCVMFAYLQHKRQVNFYHSQPIHRTRLFLNQYAVGFVMNMVLMLIMLAVSMLMVVMYGLGDGLSMSGVLCHVFNIIVLSLASYSISVLAGQLTGTVLTHLAIMLVMHFAVPLAAVIVTYMGEIFFATFNMDFPMATLNFSPLCAMITLLSGYSTRYLLQMTAPVMGTAMLVTLLAIGIGFAVLSWYLYQKRPSEATGKSLIYPVTEPIVKAYLMFVGALGCGFVFYAVGDQAFFYFGVLAFAILIHMICQVIIEHDFKAIFHKMNHCAVIVVLICAAVGVARFDLIGYDNYLPEPDKVSAVSLRVNNLEQYYAIPNASDDATVKGYVYDLLKPVVEEELYRGSRFSGYQYSAAYTDKETDFTSINVIYTLDSGREVARKYYDVPVVVIEDSFAKLYNTQAYLESCYGDVLQAPFEKVAYLSVASYTLYSPSVDKIRETVAVDYGNAVMYETAEEIRPVATVSSANARNNFDTSELPDEYSPEAAALAEALFTAYKQDLLDRDFSTLEQVVEQSMTVQILTGGSISSSRGYSAAHYDLPVYASDKRTMAILQQYNLHKSDTDYGYELALVFRCDAAGEQQLREILTDIPQYAETGTLTEQELLDGIAANDAGVIIGRIEGKDAVNAFISDARLRNNGSLFANYDATHYCLLQYPHEVKGTSGREWRVELFYEGTVPAEYQ